MTFLLRLAGLFALSLPIIVVLHMRRSRPRPLPVTTLRFWQEATRHQRQRLAWRRPPRILLLLAQLLIAALLAVALARPALPLERLPGDQPARQLIVLLDRSTAMRATDVAPSRFEAAKARAAVAPTSTRRCPRCAPPSCRSARTGSCCSPAARSPRRPTMPR